MFRQTHLGIQCNTKTRTSENRTGKLSEFCKKSDTINCDIWFQTCKIPSYWPDINSLWRVRSLKTHCSPTWAGFVLGYQRERPRAGFIPGLLICQGLYTRDQRREISWLLGSNHLLGFNGLLYPNGILGINGLNETNWPNWLAEPDCLLGPYGFISATNSFSPLPLLNRH